MKLVIQIPCYNEENNIAAAVSALPKKINGIDEIEVLIIDDGSTDKTIEAAKNCQVNHVIQQRHKGLAKAFAAGLKKSVEIGADIIVHTDADNQYCADDIENLIKPIFENEADIVIGERPIWQMKQFSFVKKCLQKIGTYVVRVASSYAVHDATSGFRAYSKSAATKLNVFETYSPMLEMIIQAPAVGLKIKSVPIRVNSDYRKSRLIKSIPDYIIKQMFIILKTFLIHRPFKCFLFFSAFFMLLGIISGVYAFNFYSMDSINNYLTSVIISALLLCLSVNSLLMGLFSYLIIYNRKILEKMSEK